MTEVIAVADAEAGDLIVVSGHHVGEPEQLGEIVEVLGTPGHRHFSVRWDDGHESVFYPGSDATVRRAKHGAARGRRR